MLGGMVQAQARQRNAQVTVQWVDTQTLQAQLVPTLTTARCVLLGGTVTAMAARQLSAQVTVQWVDTLSNQS